jgi:hypothetical protein
VLGLASLARCNSVLAADDHSGHHCSSPVKQIAAASIWVALCCLGSIPIELSAGAHRLGPFLTEFRCRPSRDAPRQPRPIAPLPFAGIGRPWPGSRRPPPGLAGLGPDLAGRRRDWPALARISPATAGFGRPRPDLASHRWDRSRPSLAQIRHRAPFVWPRALSVCFLATVMSTRAIDVGTLLAVGCAFLMMSSLMSRDPSTHVPPRPSRWRTSLFYCFPTHHPLC